MPVTSLLRPGGTSRDRRPLWALAAGLLLAVALPGATVRAQETSALTAGVASQTLLLQPDQAGVVILDIAGTLPDDAEVAVVVHNRLPADRASLQAAARGDIPTPSFRILVTPVASVPRDASGRLAVQIPTTSTRSANGTEIPLRTAGVYPVEIVIRSTDRNEDLARVVTFLVRLPATAVAEPLRVALVLPLTGPPALQPDGTVLLDAALRSRVQLLTDTLEAAPGLPVTVMLQPELLEALGRTGLPTDVELRTRLATLLADRQTLPAPYVPMDPTAAVAAGLGDELTAQLRRGEDVIAEQLGPSSAERTIWSTLDGLDDTTVAFLRDLGFRQLLVPASAIDGEVVPTTGVDARPVSVRSTGSDRPLTVGADDEALSQAFTAHAEPVRDAYAWLAEVALMSIAADEARAGPVGVVVQPESWDADPGFLATVLAGLQGNPLVRPATAAQYFTEVPPAVGDDGQLVERSLAPSAPEDLTGYAADRTTSQLGLVAFGSMVAPTSSLPAELDQLLQVSPARDLSPQARSAYLTAVDEQLDELRQSIDQVPARTITLAGRTTELPITLTSRAKEPLQVKVRLRSSKLAFPEGNERLVTITDGAAPVRVPIEARTSGTFPVTIDVLTPIGDQVVAPSSQLTVRSTGLSGLGLALSVGALLVLALWWTRHVLSTRRAKRATAAAIDHPSTAGARDG